MNAMRIAGLTGALCLGLMAGLMLGGESYSTAVLFSALGAGLMIAICAFAEWRWSRSHEGGDG